MEKLQLDVNAFLADIRQSVFNSDDIPTEDVTIENWNGITFRVLGMTAAQQYEMLQASVDPETKTINFSRMYPEVVISCTHAILPDDTTGPCVFERTDKELLAQKAAENIEKLAKVAMSLSGMRDNAELDKENSK